MAHKVVYSPDARRDIASILNWIDAGAGPHTAVNYIDQLEEACESLATFPNRGTPRRSSLRSINFRRRATIIYRVGQHTVTIMRIHHRGRDTPA